MAEYENFDRQYRLAAGDFEIGETTKECPVAPHVNFSFQKTDLESQNTGKLSVWNLSPEHLAALNQTDCALSFRAGYGNRLSLIFAGVITFITTKPDGADVRTDIEVVDNRVEIRDTYVSLTYNGTVSWKTILSDTAGQMGVAVTFSYNASFADVPNGFSYVGLARDILSKGCGCCNLTWSLQNGILQIKKPGDTMNREVYVLSKDTGLLGVPERVVVSKSEIEDGESVLGWDVEYFLNGAINIDDYVKLETKAVTGFFRAYSIDMQGDNASGDWICKARLLEVK